jgi:hypothetical protein
MVTILSVVVSILAFRFRSRASLELRLIALQHQLAVLRRQRPGRPQLSSLDRLLWVWLYRVWPQVIDGILIARGRDAADVPLTHTFGPGTLPDFRVWAEEAPANSSHKA